MNQQDYMMSFQKSLGEIETSMRSLAEDMRELRKDLRGHVDDDSEKFDKLDREKAYAKGVGWVVLSILGAAATFLGAVIIPAIAGWVTAHFP